MESIVGTLAMTFVLLVSSCGHVQNASTPINDSLLVNNDTFRIDYKIQLPELPSENLQHLALEFASEQMGGTYDGDLNDVRSLLSHYVGERMQEQRKEIEELAADSTNSDYIKSEIKSISYSTSYYVDTMALTPQYVTILTNTITNCSLAAHGVYYTYGVTLRASDGRRMGWEIIRDKDDDKFQAILREAILGELASPDGEEILEAIKSNNLGSIPLPQCLPLFTPDGLCFYYNIYEIASYACGALCPTIPYNKLRPFLTATAKQLIDAK